MTNSYIPVYKSGSHSHQAHLISVMRCSAIRPDCERTTFPKKKMKNKKAISPLTLRCQSKHTSILKVSGKSNLNVIERSRLIREYFNGTIPSGLRWKNI